MQYNTTPSPSNLPESGNSYVNSPRSLVDGDSAPLVFAAFLAWKLLDMKESRIEYWIPCLLAAVKARYISKPSTAEKADNEASRLLKYLSRTAVHWHLVTASMVADWCEIGRPDKRGHFRNVAPNTAANRVWVAKAVLEAARSLGADIDVGALLDNAIIRQPSKYAMRPLTNTEANRVRGSAQGGIVSTTQSILISLAFAGATTSETTKVTASSIDPIRGVVHLKGENKRINPFDRWGWAEIAFQLRNRTGLDPHVPLCVSPHLTHNQAKHSVTVRLRRVLEDAGISHRPGVVPRSIRYTTAHRIAHAHGIVAATRFLGVDSVDDTIEVLRRALPEGGGDG